MRATAEELRDSVLDHREAKTHQALYERDVMMQTSMHRLDQLDIGQASLVFGRIDRTDDATFYIGRLAITGEDQEPLVLDWRVPAAEAFYRATGRHPLDLRRRRHFFCEGRKLLGIEDETFAGGGEGNELGLAGTGALLAALERSRTGRMRDIVATVQREQDEVIRSELPGVLAVQGGPGTGKTAVALHRAAYLLFTYRRQLGGREGVLVVGPNPLFLRYIDQVLPALGESGVELATINGLIPGLRVGATDSPMAARVKSDVRMAKVMARAVTDRERALRRDVPLSLGPYRFALTVADSEAVVRSVRRISGTHNARRRNLERLVFRRLHAAYLAAVSASEHVQTSVTEADLHRELRDDPAVAQALDRMWPVVTGPELLHDLLGAPPLIASAGNGILTRAEIRALHRPRSQSWRTVPWTSADLALIDELNVRLGVPRRRPVPDDEADDLPLFGHIVVDEAQDLSPMQLRMLARRSNTGSMTIVGDIAQATGAWAPNEWEDVLQHLPSRRGQRTAELTVNYRTPAEIMGLAARVLAASAPDLDPPSSVRSTGESPVVVPVDPGRLVAEVAARAQREHAAVGDGTVAVIASASMVDELSAGLDELGVPHGDVAHEGLEAAITLLPVGLVKGLEFDSVVLVEPARLVRESAQGLRALYVAMTRATKRLTIVHSEALPDALREEPPVEASA